MPSRLLTIFEYVLLLFILKIMKVNVPFGSSDIDQNTVLVPSKAEVR